MESLKPTLHYPVPMNTRVRIPDSYLNRKSFGTVVGVSSSHIVFLYIVLLDEPFQADFGEIRALSVIGSELVSEDGLTDWRLKK